ncbi:MAG TPA: response regulator [Nostocaceae cyanobacterium]|nr:response regulator [Nostocaceae cyanobacterium]
MLEIFLSNPSRIFSRDALLNRIWPNDDFPSEEAVTTQIKGLRQKLKAAGMTVDLIQTVYGVGYRLKEQEDVKKHSLKFPTITQHKNSQKNPNQIITNSSMNKPNFTPEEIKTMAIIEDMRESYQENIKEKLELFLQLVLQLLTNAPVPTLLEQSQVEAHRLAGSLGSFGFPDSSKVAREIELLLQNNANNNDRQEVAYQLRKLTKKLERTLQKLPSTPNIITNSSNIVTSELLIIDDDIALAERIKVEAKICGLQVKIASSLEAAKAVITDSLPDVILLDLSFPNDEENALAFLAAVRQKKSDIPVLIFTAHDQLSYRLDAARLGADGFLNKSIGVSEVLTVVTELLKPKFTTEAKVIVVDDDHLVLNLVRRLLSNKDIEVIILQDSRKFWELLEATHPDLLILDIKMPEFSGIDLCQVVRNDPKWRHLPVVFMSVTPHKEIIAKFYEMGADDYLQKPIIESEFVPRILNRLELIKQRKRLKN